MDEKDLAPANGESADDTYVIEDTGESLTDFQYQQPEDGAGQPGGAPGVAGAGGEALQEENQKLKDQYLRARADFENFRKRAEREKTEYFKFALAQSFRDLLPVLDNFERALETDPAASEEFKRGIDLIYKQFSETLQKYGLTVINEVGVPFDPNRHEAVMREESSDFPSHSVMGVLQKGYFLNERLLRPAMVKVSIGTEGEESSESEG